MPTKTKRKKKEEVPEGESVQSYTLEADEVDDIVAHLKRLGYRASGPLVRQEARRILRSENHRPKAGIGLFLVHHLTKAGRIT